MSTKLTLHLDEALIEKAKQQARKTGKSVSQLVADYFAAIGEQDEFNKDELPPITRSLYGALAGESTNESDYYAYLEEKYR